MSAHQDPLHKISVIVPQNPFLLKEIKRPCLCVLDVEKLMEWWPGKPHSPHRDASKVKAIQRSLDWKRVAQIAAYLLQKEILDTQEKLNKYFTEIYEPKVNDPGREWPPKVTQVTGFQTSEFPIFSNILVHVNGVKMEKKKKETNNDDRNDASKTNDNIATLIFDEDDPNLHFSIIDGQHRVNGAYFALCILKEEQNNPNLKWEIPAEIFLDLDPADGPPKNQAQIFIDINFNQKKVDRSLVADLYPTARAFRETMGNRERAQDIGRKLMLEKGPLVGMIQIPGIRYGVKDVITLATLNGAIENILEDLMAHEITSLEMQTDFLAQCLTAWLEASGRFEKKSGKKINELDSQNVVYQGRVLVSILALIPAILWKLKSENTKFISSKAFSILTVWLKDIAKRANLLDGDIFIDKKDFKEKGFLGSGGIGRFRDSLWAVIRGNHKLTNKTDLDKIVKLAQENRAFVRAELNKFLVDA
jgi:DGQHR domain-containing protein